MTTKRPRGRPTKPDADRQVRVQLSLSPHALELIDAQPGQRSALIERLIVEAYGRTNL